MGEYSYLSLAVSLFSSSPVTRIGIFPNCYRCSSRLLVIGLVYLLLFVLNIRLRFELDKAWSSRLSVDPIVFLGVDSSIFPNIRLRLLEVSLGLRRTEATGFILFRISDFDGYDSIGESDDSARFRRL
jgi:hypothetical protein